MRSSGRISTTTWAQRLVLAVAVTLSAACSDISAPELQGMQASTQQSARLTGSYEVRDLPALASGAQVYLAQVVFGDSTHADGRTYLLQLGVRTSTGSRSVLHQSTYEVRGDSVSFAGGGLRPGVLTAGGTTLHTAVTVDGQQLELSLQRR